MEVHHEKDMPVPPPINWATKPPRINQSHQATMANSSYSGTTANNDSPVNMRRAFNPMTNVSNNDHTYSPVDNTSYTGFVYPDTPTGRAPTAADPFNGVGLKLRDKTVGPMTPNTAQANALLKSPEVQGIDEGFQLTFSGLPHFPKPPPGHVISDEFIRVNQEWALSAEEWLHGFRCFLGALDELAGVETLARSEMRFDWHLYQRLSVKLPAPHTQRVQQLINKAFERAQEKIDSKPNDQQNLSNFDGNSASASGFSPVQFPSMVQPAHASGVGPHGQLAPFYTPAPGSMTTSFLTTKGKQVTTNAVESPTTPANRRRGRTSIRGTTRKVSRFLFIYIVNH
jgi:hypothetical protein